MEDSTPTLGFAMADFCKERIATALAACEGRRDDAARLLGVSLATMYRFLARWPDVSLAHPTRRRRRNSKKVAPVAT